MNKILIATFLLFSSGVCFGQSTYKGLTPGKSTKADVGQVLGQPVQNVSKTLIEYKSPEGWGRSYVQYRDESPAAVVDRLEIICSDTTCAPVMGKLLQPLKDILEDALVGNSQFTVIPFKRVRYYGTPRFIVYTDMVKADNSIENRLAFYSRELYESAIPKGGCTGTLFGTWDTDRGRATFTRTGDSGVTGTYSKNNGTFSLKNTRAGLFYDGEWKDDSGSGTMTMKLERSKDNETFSARLVTFQEAGTSPARNSIGSAVGGVIQSLTPNWTGTCVP